MILSFDVSFDLDWSYAADLTIRFKGTEIPAADRNDADQHETKMCPVELQRGVIPLCAFIIKSLISTAPWLEVASYFKVGII